MIKGSLPKEEIKEDIENVTENKKVKAPLPKKKEVEKEEIKLTPQPVAPPKPRKARIINKETTVSTIKSDNDKLQTSSVKNITSENNLISINKIKPSIEKPVRKEISKKVNKQDNTYAIKESDINKLSGTILNALSEKYVTKEEVRAIVIAVLRELALSDVKSSDKSIDEMIEEKEEKNKSIFKRLFSKK